MGKYDKWITYVHEVVLPGSGEVVKFRPLKVKNMKRFLIIDDNVGSIENAIDDVLQDCIISENINVDDLYLQDRFFLIVELRKRSKGSLYKFNYTCQKCNSQSLQTIDLNVLKVKNPDCKEEEVKLNDNITVLLSLLKRKDQKEAVRLANNMNMSSYQMALMDSAMLLHASGIKKIITPEGVDEPSLAEKTEFINDISPGEYEIIRDWYENRDFGVDLKHTIKCPHCLDEKEVEVPMDNFFF
jgi:hypothetical protein